MLYLVEKYQVVIIVGQTGCGKTTREDLFALSLFCRCFLEKGVDWSFRDPTVSQRVWLGEPRANDLLHTGTSVCVLLEPLPDCSPFPTFFFFHT